MEFKRKQKVLRQKFCFRVIVCVLSLIVSVIYLKCNDNINNLWSVIIGVSGSALVWSLVELVDFFVNTFYQYESERNILFGFVFEYFGKIKQVIRANIDNEIPMHEIKKYINELYDEVNNFIFSNSIYPISIEFYKCSNYIERMYWKFDACCQRIYDECEEKNDLYYKLYDSIIKEENKKEKSSKRFFEGIFIEKALSNITNIELSFDKFELSESIAKEVVVGKIGETFTVPENERTIIMFIPDIEFFELNKNSKMNAFKVVIGLIFRKFE